MSTKESSLSEPQVLTTGIPFGESPRWHDDRLWFADSAVQELIAVDLEGNSDVIVRVLSFPFCIDFLPDGRLLIVSARDRLLLRREPDGSIVTIPTSAAAPPTASASTRKARSGTGTSPRALRARARRRRGAEDDRPRSWLLRMHARGANRRTLFMVAREWHGSASMADESRTGQILTVEAPAPGAGSPGWVISRASLADRTHANQHRPVLL